MIPHALQPKNQNIKQNQYCNKFSKGFESHPHQKKKKKQEWHLSITLQKTIAFLPASPFSEPINQRIVIIIFAGKGHIPNQSLSCEWNRTEYIYLFSLLSGFFLIISTCSSLLWFSFPKIARGRMRGESHPPEEAEPCFGKSLIYSKCDANYKPAQ